MTVNQIARIEEMRVTAKQRFQQGFKEANTPIDLVQAYAKYCGNLEAILDTVECIELSKKVR